MPPSRRKPNFGETPKHVVMAERSSKALRLRRAGYTPAEILERVPEFVNEKQVRADLRRQLKAMIQEPAQELLALQYHRYEVLIRSIWKLALSQDLMAHDRILRLIEGQNKLLGLGRGSIGEDDHSDVERWLSGLIDQVRESESDDISDE